MEMGILGLPKAGKTTLFNILTGGEQATDKFTRSGDVHVGAARVADPRLEKLRDMYSPKKYTPATVTYVDVPGIERGQGGEGEGLDLNRLKDAAALMHVVRAFDDPELPHPDGSVDPGRDVANVDLELVLDDHSLVERRIERLEKSKKRGLSADEQRELKLLAETILPALEDETPLRELTLDPDDERRLRGFQLLTAKPMLVVVNVGEDEVASADPEALGVVPAPKRDSVVVSAPIEQEISRLDPEEASEFLADLGLEEPSAARITRASFELLGLIAFFTVGEDEVRAWTVRRGIDARRAGGAIHSDIERGFIRAEVVPWDDLLRLGSLAACREQAVLRLEGKEYVVKDGDVVHFRFNV
ncbi:MAG TPA: redox-regulated ATPase YchF [Thermoanaerobaculia bacterium]|nr:redox-regulated ATPase YchF [Thermoanaerobaculia bacterium]